LIRSSSSPTPEVKTNKKDNITKANVSAVMRKPKPVRLLCTIIIIVDILHKVMIMNFLGKKKLILLYMKEKDDLTERRPMIPKLAQK
jgi:hypothetical protein